MQYLQFVGIIITFGILGWFGICDLRRRSLPGKALIVSILLSFGFRILLIGMRSTTVQEGLAALVPAMILLMLSWGTGEKIGYGDGLLLLLMGNLLTGTDVWKILSVSICLTFPVSLVLLLSGKASGNTRLPFVPFLFVSACLVYGIRLV